MSGLRVVVSIFGRDWSWLQQASQPVSQPVLYIYPLLDRRFLAWLAICYLHHLDSLLSEFPSENKTNIFRKSRSCLITQDYLHHIYIFYLHSYESVDSKLSISSGHQKLISVLIIIHSSSRARLLSKQWSINTASETSPTSSSFLQLHNCNHFRSANFLPITTSHRPLNLFAYYLAHPPLLFPPVPLKNRTFSFCHRACPDTSPPVVCYLSRFVSFSLYFPTHVLHLPYFLSFWSRFLVFYPLFYHYISQNLSTPIPSHLCPNGRCDMSLSTSPRDASSRRRFCAY